jgi:mycothiol system anti-sigma-R factor
MSHSDDHDSTRRDPCADVLRQMYFFIDNELADADSREIQQHIDECLPCLREVDVERIVKALIARSCTEHAPPELRQRVVFSIRQVQLELRHPNPGSTPGE